MKEWIQLCFSKAIVKRALMTAVIVGTVLLAINHGDAILRGQMNTDRWLKAALTVLVPYLVSTISSVSTLMSLQKEHEVG
jgi:hypothetical protein